MNTTDQLSLKKELQKLFMDLKGNPKEERIDPQTILYYFFNSGVYKRYPQFFIYLYNKLKDRKRMTEKEMVETLSDFEDLRISDVE